MCSSCRLGVELSVSRLVCPGNRLGDVGIDSYAGLSLRFTNVRLFPTTTVNGGRNSLDNNVIGTNLLLLLTRFAQSHIYTVISTSEFVYVIVVHVTVRTYEKRVCILLLYTQQ